MGVLLSTKFSLWTMFGVVVCVCVCVCVYACVRVCVCVCVCACGTGNSARVHTRAVRALYYAGAVDLGMALYTAYSVVFVM